mmetsp:Transcript_46439/g.140648  ORF Transcript_46439/g.140648 Transcript_46439/m.140648 type:complete len:223 (+) Transcript_46439:328-996(+)
MTTFDTLIHQSQQSQRRHQSPPTYPYLVGRIRRTRQSHPSRIVPRHPARRGAQNEQCQHAQIRVPISGHRARDGPPSDRRLVETLRHGFETIRGLDGIDPPVAQIGRYGMQVGRVYRREDGTGDVVVIHRPGYRCGGSLVGTTAEGVSSAERSPPSSAAAAAEAAAAVAPPRRTAGELPSGRRNRLHRRRRRLGGGGLQSTLRAVTIPYPQRHRQMFTPFLQ